jgi:hypothetical protein
MGSNPSKNHKHSYKSENKDILPCLPTIDNYLSYKGTSNIKIEGSTNDLSERSLCDRPVSPSHEPLTLVISQQDPTHMFISGEKLSDQYLELNEYCHYLGDMTNGKHGAGKVKYIIQFGSNNLEELKSLNSELYEQCNLKTMMAMCEKGYQFGHKYSAIVIIKGQMNGYTLIDEGQVEWKIRQNLGLTSLSYKGYFQNGYREGHGQLDYCGGLKRESIIYQGLFNHNEFTGTRTDNYKINYAAIGRFAKKIESKEAIRKPILELKGVKLMYDGLQLTSDAPIDVPQLELEIRIDFNRQIKLSDNIIYTGNCEVDGHGHGHGYGKYSINLSLSTMENNFLHPFLAPITVENIINCKNLINPKPDIISCYITVEGQFNGHSMSGLGGQTISVSNGMYNIIYLFEGEYENGVRMGPGSLNLSEAGSLQTYVGHFDHNRFNGICQNLGSSTEQSCKGEFINAGAFIIFRPD